MIASVSGRRSVTAVPRPGRESSCRVPPKESILRLDDVHADAAPGDVGDALGGAHPRQAAEQQLLALAPSRRPARRSTSPRATRRARRCAPRPCPRPSSSTRIQTQSRSRPASTRIGRPRVLARGGARRGLLDPVVDRVAHQVDEHVAELLEDGAVQLDPLAGDLEADLLARGAREVAHDARQPVGDQLERHHAHGHDRVLEAAHERAQALEVRVQLLALEVAADLLEPLARDDQLADDVDQLVEHAGVDPHRRGPPRRVAVGQPGRPPRRGPLHRGLARERAAPARPRRAPPRRPRRVAVAEAQPAQLQLLQLGYREQLRAQALLRAPR